MAASFDGVGGVADGWAWELRSCAGKASGRMGHSLVHLAARGALLSFGGFVKGVKGGYSTQVLVLDLPTLTWGAPAVEAPRAPVRHHHGP